MDVNCPSPDELSALCHGEVTGDDRDRLLAHAEHCDTCSGQLETLASRWSIGHLGGEREAGEATLAIRNRLAAPPPVAGPAGDTAAVPRSLPVIPGIDGLEPVGRGGMGVVYRGRDAVLGRVVAVKVMSAWAPLSESARERAKREALLLARLSHPNVVAIHAAGEVEGVPYLVMEWVAGPTLQERIDIEPLRARDAAGLALDLARAVEQVHALGIVHRDIKPGNVLLAAVDSVIGHPRPKLADFGLARPEAVTQHLTRADDVLGTPGFMAPEQTGLDPAMGETGPATDVHGLGGVLFAMLAGAPPFAAATPLESMQRSVRGELSHPERLSGVPADLRTIVVKCLEPVPAHRYRSAGELADDLERFLDRRPILARPAPVWERLAKWCRRRPLAATAATLAAALVALAVGGTAYHVGQLRLANDRVSLSRDRAEEAIDVAARSMERLTGASIKRMLFRGEALDEGDLEYLRQVRDEFAEWPLGADPVAGLWFRARGLQRVAGLCFDVSHYDDALVAQQAELAALTELAGLLPGDQTVIRGLLGAHYRMRYSLYHLKRTAEAVESSRESIRLLEAAPADLPRRERDLIDTRLYLGVFLQQQGQAEEGAAIMAEALDDLRALRQRQPDDIELAMQELHGLHDAQVAASNGGRRAEQARWLERLVAAGDQTLAAFAGHEQFPVHQSGIVSSLTLGLGGLATIARDDGRLEDALAFTQRRVDLCRTAFEDSTVIEDVHRTAIDALLVAAQLAYRLDRFDESQESADSALALAEKVNAAAPAIHQHTILLARALTARSERMIAAGDPDAARAILERIMALTEPWLGKEHRSTDAAFFFDWARQRIAGLPDAALVSDR